jgi:phosphoribosylanthranilate isomerase
MDHEPTKVKICGVTRLADANLAAELGAWSVGMVFYEHSPRQCSIEQAREIAASLRRRVALCGVFVNATLDQVATLADELQLAIVQLHGDEGPAYCTEVARRTGAKICKAIQVGAVGDLRDLGRFHVDYHLLDGRSTSAAGAGLRGGTGESFDWELLHSRRSSVPLILSGGLHPRNVAAAIDAVHPFAVDTATGTESSPGVKDEHLLRGFFSAVGPVALGSPAT